MFTNSGAGGEIDKLKSHQRRRQKQGARLEDEVFRQFLCDGQLRRWRGIKSSQKKEKPKDDISPYGQYYLPPVLWNLQSGKKSKLNNQQEALARQSVGYSYLASTKAFITFCKESNRFREAEFLKKITLDTAYIID